MKTTINFFLTLSLLFLFLFCVTIIYSLEYFLGATDEKISHLLPVILILGGVLSVAAMLSFTILVQYIGNNKKKLEDLEKARADYEKSTDKMIRISQAYNSLIRDYSLRETQRPPVIEFMTAIVGRTVEFKEWGDRVCTGFDIEDMEKGKVRIFSNDCQESIIFHKIKVK